MARDTGLHAQSKAPRQPAARGRYADRVTCSAVSHLERLRAARLIVAELLEVNPRYAPIFLRLEREVEWEEAKRAEDPLTRARAIVAQNEIGASKAATVSRRPPSP